jgi:hypothetical protein
MPRAQFESAANVQTHHKQSRVHRALAAVRQVVAYTRVTFTVQGKRHRNPQICCTHCVQERESLLSPNHYRDAANRTKIHYCARPLARWTALITHSRLRAPTLMLAEHARTLCLYVFISSAAVVASLCRLHEVRSQHCP